MQVFPTPSAELLSWIVRIFIYGFKIIGLAPLSLDRHTKIPVPIMNARKIYIRGFLFSKFGLLYNLLLLILNQIMAVLHISQMSTYSYVNKTSLTQIMDVASYALCSATNCFIVVYLALRQNKVAFIMNRLLGIHCILSGPKERLSKRRTFVLAVHILFHIVLWMIFVFTSGVFASSFLHASVDYCPVFIIYWFFIGYSIILEIVAGEFKKLNKYLLNLQEFPNNIFYTSLTNDRLAILGLPNQRQLPTLQLLHNVRTTLFEVSQDVSDFFSLPILPAIASFSLTLIYAIYYFITPIIFPITDVSLKTHINSMIWIFLTTYPLILISLNVTAASKKAKQTGQLVHKLLVTAREKEIIAELEQFSLQLIHEDLSFTAYGFFALDFTLLRSIFGATITYLIIIIQFMQSTST